MRIPRFRGLLALLLVMAPLGAAVAAESSPFLLQREYGERAEVGYRFQHPHLANDGSGISTFSGLHEFWFAAPIGATSAVSVSLPLLKFSVDGASFPYDETNWGNIVVGFQSRVGSRGQNSAGCDIELPTAQNNGFNLYLGGLLSNPASLTTFLPDAMSVRPYLQTRSEPAEGTLVRVRIGPNLILPVGDSSGDGEVGLDYGLGLGVETGTVAISIEFAGLWLVTGDGDSFGENSQHVFSAGVEYLGRVVAPGLYYVIPTDEMYDDVLDGVLGLRLRVRP